MCTGSGCWDSSPLYFLSASWIPERKQFLLSCMPTMILYLTVRPKAVGQLWPETPKLWTRIKAFFLLSCFDYLVPVKECYHKHNSLVPHINSMFHFITRHDSMYECITIYVVIHPLKDVWIISVDVNKAFMNIQVHIFIFLG